MDPRQSFRVFLAQVAPAHAAGIAHGEQHAQQDEAAGGEVASAGPRVGEQPGGRVEGVVDLGADDWHRGLHARQHREHLPQLVGLDTVAELRPEQF